MNKRMDRWVPSKTGFINFWVYENEEYDFHKGNILFRGENGQGKSVSMQSIIPLLLDGNKHSSRIDPFGSSKRKIIDYFKVSDVVNIHKIGYLYLTYERELSKEIVTTGIGMKPTDDSKVDFWGFILKGERIGQDLPLTKSSGFNKDGLEEFTPLSKIELKRILKEKNNAVYVDTQRDYAEEVNKHVYKFENVDLFKELTDLLIQIRSPKLSKEMKPTILYEALKNALPELPSSDYSMISNTIKDIDDRNRKIDNTEKDLVLAKELAHEYEKYRDKVFSHSAYRFLEAMKNQKRLAKSVSKIEEALISEMADHKKVKEKIEDLEIEKDTKQRKLDLFETPELRTLKNDKERKEKDFSKKEGDLKKKTALRDSNESEMMMLKKQLKSFEDACYEIERKLKNDIRDIELDAEEIQFQEKDTYISAAKDNLVHFRKDKGYFTTWTSRLKEHINNLNRVLKLFDEERRMKDLAESKKEEMRENESKIEEARKTLKSSIKAMEKEKENYKAEFRKWVQKNEEFYIAQDKIGELMNIVENLYDFSDMVPNVYDRELSNVKDALLGSINEKFYDNRSNMKKLFNELGELEVEMKKLENVTEIEPLRRRIETKNQRNLLKEENIPFVPFYEAVEFVEGLSEVEKERIESSLYDMNVLDALIVPKRYYNNVVENDAVLLPQVVKVEHGEETLDSYLTVVIPEVDVSESDIKEVLQSIVVGSLEKSSSITLDGGYRNGILQGKAIKQSKTSFIGKEARRRHREEKMAEVKQQISEIEEKIDELEEKDTKILQRKDSVGKEYEERPVLDKVAHSHEQKKQKENVLINFEEISGKLKTIHQVLSDNYVRSRNERIAQSSFLSGPKDRETVAMFVEVADGVHRDAIQELANGFHTFETKKVEQQGSFARLENLEVINDEVKSEIDGLNREIKTIQKEIENIDDRLKILGMDKAEEEITKIRQRLTEIEIDMPMKIEERTNRQNGITQLQSEIERNQRELSFANELLEARKEVFENAVRFSDMETVTDIHNLAREKQNEQANISEAIQKMQESVYSVRSKGLEDYSLTSHESVSGTYDINLQEYEDKKDFISILRDERKRVNIVLFVKGEKMNPRSFHDLLESQLMDQKSYLKKEEESLIKNVMIQGIGEKIRHLIVKAESWKNDINRYMKEMNNSISLRLIWSPITKEDMGGEVSLSTTKLVELLGRDYETLKDSDIEALSGHFMAKINTAKENLNNKKNKKSDAENLEQALKQVLDYRDWYQFRIMYQLPGEKEKTLNEDNLPKLSGGEKAMAIYIPLFSAAYSKYSAAGDDAPYLMALDEAYAGVDENNISEMFGFMERFGFDYILTSQALWADYETVPGINIYEMSFDKEARFVFSEPWRWNGEKLMINEDMLKKSGLYANDDGLYEGEPVQDEFEFDFKTSK